VPFAVTVGAVATPLAFVTAVAVVDEPNTALAPVPGAVNVTVAPLTGLPVASVTVACNAVANAALITALCGVPAVAAMFGTPIAAPLRLTDPVPAVITHVTVRVCPAVAAR
jgi:hypothetical protein